MCLLALVLHSGHSGIISRRNVCSGFSKGCFIYSTELAVNRTNERGQLMSSS